MEDEVEMTVPKKRGRGRPKGLSVKRKNYGKEFAEPGDMSQFVRHAMVAWEMPPIDISDITQVEARAEEYFKYCIDNDCIPNKITLCNWIGIDNRTLYNWRIGVGRQGAHQEFAKKVDSLTEAVLVEVMLSNKVMPANGIFLLKNHAGYRDQIDIAPVVQNPLGDIQDMKALAERINADVTDD